MSKTEKTLRSTTTSTFQRLTDSSDQVPAGQSWYLRRHGAADIIYYDCNYLCSSTTTCSLTHGTCSQLTTVHSVNTRTQRQQQHQQTESKCMVRNTDNLFYEGHVTIVPRDRVADGPAGLCVDSDAKHGTLCQALDSKRSTIVLEYYNITLRQKFNNNCARQTCTITDNRHYGSPPPPPRGSADVASYASALLSSDHR